MAFSNGAIALLTDRRYTAAVAPPGDWYLGNILREDELLATALSAHGLTAVRVDWADPKVDWGRFQAAVFRTTWDYFDRFADFSRWLDGVTHATRLINPLSTIRWNIDKHYLGDLHRRGVPTVETAYLEKGDPTPLGDWLGQSRWRQAVIKPCISGAARLTYRFNEQNAEAVERELRPWIERESFLIQPFQQSILTEGEITLMMFSGKVTHAVRKRAKAGDFRVQDDFGGSVHDHEPSAEEIEVAEAAMGACSPLPVYGRVDLVRDGSGRLAVMELEVIEPELWMRRHPPAAQAFAAAIAAELR